MLSSGSGGGGDASAAPAPLHATVETQSEVLARLPPPPFALGAAFLCVPSHGEATLSVTATPVPVAPEDSPALAALGLAGPGGWRECTLRGAVAWVPRGQGDAMAALGAQAPVWATAPAAAGAGAASLPPSRRSSVGSTSRAGSVLATPAGPVAEGAAPGLEGDSVGEAGLESAVASVLDELGTPAVVVPGSGTATPVRVSNTLLWLASACRGLLWLLAPTR